MHLVLSLCCIAFRSKKKVLHNPRPSSHRNRTHKASETESNEDDSLEETDSAQEDEESEHSLIGGQNEHHSSKSQWSDEDVERLKRLKAAAVEDDDICCVLHRSSDVIMRKWREIKELSVSFHSASELNESFLVRVTFNIPKRYTEQEESEEITSSSSTHQPLYNRQRRA